MATNLTVAKDPDIPRNSSPPRSPAPSSHSTRPEVSIPTRVPPITVSFTFRTIGPKEPPSASDRYEKSPPGFSSDTKISFDPNDSAYASFMQILHTRMEARNMLWGPESADVNIKARMRESWSLFDRRMVDVNADSWEVILEHASKGSLRGFEVDSEYRM